MSNFNFVKKTFLHKVTFLRLENLAKEERELWCCLQDVDHKLDDWVKPVDTQPARITLTIPTTHDNGLQNEVRISILMIY